AVGANVETLQARLDELTAQVGAQAQNTELDELRSSVAELAARPAADPSLGADLGSVQSRLDELGTTVSELAARPTGDATLGEAVEELRVRLDELVTTAAGHASSEDVATQRAIIDDLSAGLAGHA